MAPNRILYLCLLVLSATFYFASGIWFSWILLVMVLAAPWVSLLVSLPAILTCRLSVFLDETVEQGSSAALRLRLRSWPWMPLPEAQIRLNLRTRDRARDIRYLSRLSRKEGVLALSTETCGFTAPQLRKGRVFDYLGLFRLPFPLRDPLPMAILPPERQPDPMPRLEQFLQQQVKPKNGGGFSELHDHRPYRPGDPVKGIHWKLSMKTEELIVREPMEPVRRRAILALQTPRGPRARSLNLGNLRYLSRWLLDNQIPHEVVWMEGGSLHSLEIHSLQDLTTALRGACLAPEDSEDLPWPLPLQADWICPVGKKGGAMK